MTFFRIYISFYNIIINLIIFLVQVIPRTIIAAKENRENKEYEKWQRKQYEEKQRKEFDEMLKKRTSLP